VEKDDDDQEENSEVYFTITSQRSAEEHESQFGEGSYIQPRKGSSISAQEAVMSGFLNKRRPDGLGFFWQLRFFILTRSRLSYFKAQSDTRAHAQLGQLAMKDVIAVQWDEGSTEFVVVIANSQRPPYTLKAESPEDAERWVDAIVMNAPRIAAMKGGGGGSSVASEAESESMAGKRHEYEVGALREIPEEEDAATATEDAAAEDATAHNADDADSLILPPRRPTQGGDQRRASSAGTTSRPPVSSAQDIDETIWDGLPQSRRTQQQQQQQQQQQEEEQEDDDDQGSVSTRLMFASVRP
jgi:hypothetical protein